MQRGTILILLAVAFAIAGVAVGIALALRDAPAAPDADHPAMEEDARCAHMPEHCERGNASG